MKKNNSLVIRYMKYWYGITGPLDEHKRAEMEHIGNIAFFMMFLLMIPFFLISEFIFYNFNAKEAYFTLSLGVGVAILAACIYISFASHKVKLTENEVERSDLPKAKKAAYIRGLTGGLLWGIGMTIVNLFDGKDSWKIVIPIYLICGLLFGLAMAGISISRIKVIDEQD